ncbi:MAG: helix-turn-helix domain-containing protein [Alphaproteobacteria bacterium]|nr:helix-turn-helix domain-containing protein [Alphaproteobacteria bacterium]
MMTPYEAAPASAAQVGGDLRAARERLGWSVAAIAAHLRIRRPYLEALEDGRTADLPGIAYALGFLRTYAQALGLDPDEMARRFRAEAVEANRKTELNFPAPVPDRGIPAGAVILVGAVLAIGAYIGWYRLSEMRQPGPEPVPPVPAHLATLAEPATPPTPPPSPAAVQNTAPSAPASDASAAEAAPPLPSVAPSSAAAATPVPPASEPVAAAAPVGIPVAAPAAPPPAPAVDSAKPAGPRIVVRARADAWIQVRDRGGQVFLNRVLRSGESWTVPDKPALLLTTGNAGGTELLVDGTETPGLGGNGAVRRDLPLDADAIKDGKLALPTRPSVQH